MRDNKKQILLIDMDDCINTFNPHWIKLYNEKYGRKHKKLYGKKLEVSDIVDWDLHKFTLPGINVFDEFIYKKHLFKKNNFFRKVEVQLYAQEVTKELQKIFDIYIVSASHFSTVADKAEWILEHFPHIPIKHFIPCYNKFMINGDCLIDDGYHNLIDFNGKKVLIDKPWNMKFQENNLDNFIVVKSWIDIYELLAK